jgi:uncharacterized membrane protein (DUF485 family)
MSVILIAYQVYWMNTNDIGSKANDTLAIPLAIMTFAVCMVIIIALIDILPAKQRFIWGVILFVLILVLMIPYHLK